MQPPALGTVRVLVGDSTAMNGRLLAKALAEDRRIRICGSWCRSTAILAAVEASEPDLALLSSHLEDGRRKGFEVIRTLRSLRPEIPGVLLLDYSDRTDVVEAFRCGARGIFCRNQSVKLLAKCVHRVCTGQVWASSSELHFLVDSVSEGPALLSVGSTSERLSKRECDVVRAVARGFTNREIAQHLGLTEHTIKNYLFRIFDKLGVSTRVELVLQTLASAQPSSVRTVPAISVSSRPPILSPVNAKIATYR